MYQTFDTCIRQLHMRECKNDTKLQIIQKLNTILSHSEKNAISMQKIINSTLFSDMTFVLQTNSQLTTDETDEETKESEITQKGIQTKKQQLQRLQRESACLISTIASMDFLDQTEIHQFNNLLMKTFCIPRLISLISLSSSSSLWIKGQCIDAIGNIASISPLTRDLVLCNNILDELLPIVFSAANKNKSIHTQLLFYASFTLSNLCHQSPAPENKHLPFLLQAIHSLINDSRITVKSEILLNACWAFAYLSSSIFDAKYNLSSTSSDDARGKIRISMDDQPLTKLRNKKNRFSFGSDDNIQLIRDSIKKKGEEEDNCLLEIEYQSSSSPMTTATLAYISKKKKIRRYLNKLLRNLFGRCLPFRSSLNQLTSEELEYYGKQDYKNIFIADDESFNDAIFEDENHRSMDKIILYKNELRYKILSQCLNLLFLHLNEHENEEDLRQAIYKVFKNIIRIFFRVHVQIVNKQMSDREFISLEFESKTNKSLISVNNAFQMIFEQISAILRKNQNQKKKNDKHFKKCIKTDRYSMLSITDDEDVDEGEKERSEEESLKVIDGKCVHEVLKILKQYFTSDELLIAILIDYNIISCILHFLINVRNERKTDFFNQYSIPKTAVICISNIIEHCSDEQFEELLTFDMIYALCSMIDQCLIAFDANMESNHLRLFQIIIQLLTNIFERCQFIIKKGDREGINGHANEMRTRTLKIFKECNLNPEYFVRLRTHPNVGRDVQQLIQESMNKLYLVIVP